MTAEETLAPSYRYLLTDLVTNTVIAELPFSGVVYGRALNSAGSFSGSTPVILGKTNGYDLYDSTMPGQTGLYVLRNNTCVWGGIIWTRNYDLTSRALQVTAQEFTSYLHHRVIWKTFTSDYGATAVADNAGNYITLTLDTGLSADTIAPKSTVQLFFGPEVDTMFDKAYVVKNQSNNNTIQVKADVAGTTINFIRLAGKVVTVWTGFKHSFKKNTRVRVSGAPKDAYNGVHVVSQVLNDYSFSYKIDTTNTKTWKKQKMTGKVSPYNKLTPGTYYGVTVRVRTNTYDYVKSLLDSVFTDFNTVEFAYGNDPGVSYALAVTRKLQAAGVATLTTEEPHEVAVGQQITVRNLDTRLNGQFEVSAVVDENTLQYSNPGALSVSSALVSDKTAAVTTRRRKNSTNSAGNVTCTATLTTSTNHQYAVGDIVTVSDVDPADYKTVPTYNGTFTVTAVTSTSPYSFSYVIPNNVHTKKDEQGKKTGTGVTCSGTAVVHPQLIVSTAGSFSPSANIGIDLQLDDYSGNDVTPATHRGGATDNVGDALSSYADSIAGFEYRIDCDYDQDTDTFKRTFKLLEIDVPNPPDPGEVSPISRFGADKLVFTYPGNISTLSMNESAENSATRMFVTGQTAGTGSNPYYAAASATELLTPTDGSRAWPLLDAVQSKSDQGDQIVLYSYAERYLREARPPVADFKVSVNGSIAPVIGTYAPGDWCSVVADDDFIKARLSSSLEVRKTALVRKIQAFEVQVPDGVTFPESVTLTLVPEWQVDVSGN